MTDENMDTRLRAAGERWRAANTVTAERVDQPIIEVHLAPPPPRPKHHWLTALSAAVVAAALVIGGFFAFRHDDAGSVVLVRPGAALIGQTWLFVSTSTSESGAVPVNNGSLRIGDDGRMTWTGDCGIYNANVALTATTIVITDVHGGSANCSSISSAVVAKLSGRVGYVVQGSRLTLTKPGEYQLVLTSAKTRITSDPTQLSAHPWLLDGTEVTTTGLNSGGGSGHSAITLSRLSFDGHGNFTVQHRCYTDTGTAQLGNATATLTDVHLKSALPCASNAETRPGQKENDFVDTLLKGQVEWSIKAGELTISKGGTSATFAAH